MHSGARCGKDQGTKSIHCKSIVLLLTRNYILTNPLAKVYSPYQRNWLSKLNGNIPFYLEDCPPPEPNLDSIRTSDTYGPLFDFSVPDAIDGFELREEDRKLMAEIWPAGTDVAIKV